MAVDPVCPAANYKEKEYLEEQPTRARRPSIEDQDSSRPRKRLATMGTTTPQSNSPPTDKEDGMDRSPRSTTLTPSSSTIVTSPTPVTILADQGMEHTPDTPLQDPTIEDLTAGEVPAIPTEASDESKADDFLPLPSVDSNGTDDSSQEPLIILVEPEKDVSSSPSEVTSTSGSPWQDESYLRSPEVEVEEVDGMEDDEVVAESVAVIGNEYERYIPDRRDANLMARELACG